MKNPKQKGNNFERKVAKMFSEWCGEEFHRTPLSGALHWGNDKRVVSDIVPPPSVFFPFSIECKNVNYSWEFSKLVEGTSEFWSHWSQAVDDSNKEDLRPMLVFTKNYREVYACLRMSDVGVLSGFKKFSLDSLRVQVGEEDLKIFLLKNFLSTYTILDLLAFKDKKV